MAKSQLNHYCQGHHIDLPMYSTEPKSGGFSSTVKVCQQDFCSETPHPSKKLAEEYAARVALNWLRSTSEHRPEESATGTWTTRSDPQESVQLNNDFCSSPSSSLNSEYSNSPDNTLSGSIAASEVPTMSSRSSDYALKLEKLCNSHGLSPPQYNQETIGNKVVVTVSIQGSHGGEFSSGESESYNKAKEYATLIALAELGIKLLNVNEVGEDCTASTEKDEASKSHTNAAPSLPPDNYKARLNEYCQKHYLPLPIYKTEFPEDSTGYIAVVKVGDKNYVSTVEMAKKTAEQKAAGLAALDLGIFQIETKKQDESPSESQSEDSTPRNFKAVLQEFLQKRGRPCPRYSTEAETGGMFVSTVTMTDVLGRSACFESRAFSNKRIAEQDAARQACINFKI